MSTPRPDIPAIPDALWRGLAEAVPTAMVVADTERVVVWANPAARAHFGADVIGRSLDDVPGARAVVTAEGHTLAVARDERGFRAITESSPDGIVVHHLGRTTYANARMARPL